MIRYDADNPRDVQDAVDLNAEPWQLQLLSMNPSYCGWGPGEDDMSTEGRWRSRIEQGWRPHLLDDLNEVVHFYFSLRRPSNPCLECDGRGESPEYQQLADIWYSAVRTYGISEEEAEALVAVGRFPEGSTAASINEAVGHSLFGHDAINRHICTSARAKKRGIPINCSFCDGRGHLWTSDECSVDLTLWVLYPRKGASAGVRMEGIKQDELPDVFAFLREAAKRNADRFSKVPS